MMILMYIIIDCYCRFLTHKSRVRLSNDEFNELSVSSLGVCTCRSKCWIIFPDTGEILLRNYEYQNAFYLILSRLYLSCSMYGGDYTINKSTPNEG